MLKIVFLDTNIYLHYQDIEQIDWLKVLQADSVNIIVPPITIRELNKHNDYHPNKRIKKRAGVILKKLDNLFSQNSQADLKSGVSIHIDDREPEIDFGVYHLVREIQDDELIASIIMYQNEMPDMEIILATSDAGLTLLAKARKHGITTIKLADNLKLLPEPDPEQERIRELEQELLKIKLVKPQLSLTFMDGEQHAKFIFPQPVELTSDQLETRQKEVEKKYPKREIQQKSEDESHLSDLITVKELTSMASEDLLNVISSEDIAKYNAELDKFYQEYARHVQEEISFQNLKRKTIKLEIWLSNDGTAPAEDIDIYMHFPDGFNIRRDDGFSPPRPPTPPSLPKTAMGKLLESMQLRTGISIAKDLIIPRNPSPITPPPNVSSPNIKRTRSYDVDVHVEHIKHKLSEAFDALYVTFEAFDSAQSYHINYRILAANIPNETSGILHIIIEKEA